MPSAFSSSPLAARTRDPVPESSCPMEQLLPEDVKEIRNTNDDSQLFPVHETRRLVIHLSALFGNLASILLLSFPLDGRSTTIMSPEIVTAMAQLLRCLQQTAHSVAVDLEQAIKMKIELNAKKYPVELCKGKEGKYTEYSHVTGITKEEGQSTVHHLSATATTLSSDDFPQRVRSLTEAIREFAIARDWTVYHLPRNLALALAGELGELAELLQHLSDEPRTLEPLLRDKISQEIADVSIYLIRLADVCGVDLAEAIADKSSMEHSPKKSSEALIQDISLSTADHATLAAGLFPLQTTRSLILQLLALFGNLIVIARDKDVQIVNLHDEVTLQERTEHSSHSIDSVIAHMLLCLQETASTLLINLEQEICAALEKYMSKDSRLTRTRPILSVAGPMPLHLRAALCSYIEHEDDAAFFDSKNSLRNFFLALSAAMGALSEIPQWMRDEPQAIVPKHVDAMRRLIVGITIYLLWLVDATKHRSGTCASTN